MMLYAGAAGDVFVGKTEEGVPSPLVEVFIGIDRPCIGSDDNGALEMENKIVTITFHSGPKQLRQLAYSLLKLADEADAFFESVKSGTAFVSPEPTEENPK